MAQQGRVQAPEFRNNLKLAPAARPVDTYEAPAAIPQDNNSARLIDALQGFSNSLGSLAPKLATANQGKSKEELAEMNRYFMTASRPERVAYIKGNHGIDFDNTSTKQTAAAMTVMGSRYASDMQEELMEEMQSSFDWEKGNPEEYARQFMAKKLEESGHADNPNFVATYSKAGQTVVSNVYSFQQKKAIADHTQMVQGAASDYFRQTLDNSVKAGDKADDSARKFLDTSVDAGSKGTLALDDNEVDDRQVDELSRRTSSNPEIVLAALAMPRKGKGGERPSFLDDPRTRDKALHLQKLATITIKEQQNAAEKQAVLDGVLANAEQGNAFVGLRDLEQINPTSGERVVWSVEQQKKDAERVLIQREDDYAKKAGETRDQTITRRSQKFARMGLQDPDLKAATEGLADSLSPEIIQDPAQRENWLKKAALVESVTKRNKNVAASMWKGADKEAYDGFIAAREELGMGDEDALSFAYKVTNPSPESRQRLNSVRPEIDSAVRSLTSSDWFRSNGVTEGGAVEDHLKSLAEKYAIAGMTAKDAVEAAKNTIDRNSIHYNGAMVDVGVLKDRADMPVNFEGSVQAQVDHFLAESKGVIGRGDFSASDVTIKQFGDRTGTFYLVDKTTQTAVTNDKGNIHTFTLANLKAWDNANEKLQQKSEATFNVMSQSVKARGLSQVVDKEGNAVWVDKKRIIWENSAPEGETPVWKKTGQRVNATAIMTSPDGGFQLQRPDKLNKRLKVTSEFFTQSKRPSWLGGDEEPDPTTKFLNDQSKSTFGFFGNYIKVGDDAEKAIKERNAGR